MRSTTRSGAGGLALATALLLTGCGSEESPPTVEPTPTAEPTPQGTSTPSAPAPSEEPAGTTIDITFTGDEVDPDGVSREVEAGEPITLRIVADRPGEIHVHSSPEQELEYPAGTTTKTLTIDRPGVVEVESHTLDRLILQLEVR